jgi:hypothetical protein
MDSKFYHFNTDTDIPQAKIFCQSVNIGEGALGFSGGHGPLWPPLATGLFHALFFLSASLYPGTFEDNYSLFHRLDQHLRLHVVMNIHEKYGLNHCDVVRHDPSCCVEIDERCRSNQNDLDFCEVCRSTSRTM